MTDAEQRAFEQGRAQAFANIVSAATTFMTAQAAAIFLRTTKIMRPGGKVTAYDAAYQNGFMSAARDIETATDRGNEPLRR